MLHNSSYEEELDLVIREAIKSFEDIKNSWDDNVQKAFYEQHVSPLIHTLKKIKHDSVEIHSEFTSLQHSLRALPFSPSC